MRRLEALERPSGDDIRRAAAELGISTQRVNGLLRAWRQHGRTRLLVGPLDKKPDAVAAALSAAEADLDLSGIREPYRAEVARRIEVIANYLRGGRSDEATNVAFAEQYGRNLSHFRTAVTSWVLARDPTKLPGLSYMVEGGPGDHHVEPEVDTIIADVLEEIGADATITTLHRRVIQLVGAAGLRYPSLNVMQDRLRKARAAPKSAAHDPSLCLDRLALRTVEGDRPYLVTLLFGGATGYIMEHAVTSGPPSASTDAMVLAAYLGRPAATSSVGMLEMDLGEGPDWDRLASLLSEAGVQHWSAQPRRLRSGRLARNAFSGRLPGLDMLRVEKRNLPMMDPTDLVPPEIFAVVTAGISRHNEGRRSDRPLLLATGQAGFDLAERLAASFHLDRD